MEKPQNIFLQPKSQTPNYRASPHVFLTIECPPPRDKVERVFFKLFAARLLHSRTSFLFKVSSSTFIKSNKLCCQAFAARLLQSRMRFVFKPLLLYFYFYFYFQLYFLLLQRHGFSCQAIFSECQIVRPTFSKAPNSQLSTRNFWTEINLWGHRNIKPQIISTTLNFNTQKAHLRGSKFQTPNTINPTYLTFQTQNKHMRSPSSQSQCPHPGLAHPANQLSTSPMSKTANLLDKITWDTSCHTPSNVGFKQGQIRSTYLWFRLFSNIAWGRGEGGMGDLTYIYCLSLSC